MAIPELLMRGRPLVSAVAVAGTAAAAWICRPAPSPIPPPSSWRPRHVVVAGAFHVHTLDSDGSDSVDAVAAAAARAGLRFVVFTDHGDGEGPPRRPTYRHGVLCLEETEISAIGGHYIALDLPPTPYPLAGDAADVIEDVRRPGGFGVAAHPDSPKAELRWSAAASDFDGIEWLNLDSAWRAAPTWTVSLAAARYVADPPRALTLLLNRPARALATWDRLTEERTVVGFAATDAHAPFAYFGSPGLPSYDVCFRTITTRVELDAPLTSSAAADARAILDALRAGHHYTAIDGLLPTGAFEFSARGEDSLAFEGDRLERGPATIEARVAAPPGARIVLLRNGTPIDEEAGPRLERRVDRRQAAYRVEVRLGDDSRAPWIASNPIYVGRAGERTHESKPHGGRPHPTLGGRSLLAAAWHEEADGGSTAHMDVSPDRFRLAYTLGPGPRRSQLAAAVAATPGGLAGYSGLALRASSAHPVRISVQLRAERGPDSPRWWRSAYLDGTVRDVVLAFRTFTPASPGIAGEPRLDEIGAVLIDVDINHAEPASRGAITVAGVWLTR